MKNFISSIKIKEGGKVLLINRPEIFYGSIKKEGFI
jgi:hypothetical protein